MVDDVGPTEHALDATEPVIVLMHGFSFDRTSWDPQLEAFARHHRTVRYDLRGFGASGPPIAGRSHLDDLVELLAGLQIGRAHLVGLSLGANLALAAMSRRPDLVASAVLASPGLPGHIWTTPRPPDEAAEYARLHGVAATRRFWLDHAVFASTNTQPVVRAELERMVANFAALQWREDDPTAPLPSVHDRLGEIDVPTLVLHGAHDVIGYQQLARLIASGIANAQRYELAQAGHLVNLEQPAEFTARVLEFLARC